eukprot:CAMPEP_0179074010 /NCGR_PEP_ID=MMETSP0796-20121207/32866_1 /TAXON_ID=73915 /ORGANISM="Pyrodinium bahamense, Strain pbaha01" /LENGTH=142 /DNA_ID=CAMNT_0020771221 /DNA_START=1 /DNA_END=430 /DNA_ORIENTATION=-
MLKVSEQREHDLEAANGYLVGLHNALLEQRAVADMPPGSQGGAGQTASPQASHSPAQQAAGLSGRGGSSTGARSSAATARPQSTGASSSSATTQPQGGSVATECAGCLMERARPVHRGDEAAMEVGGSWLSVRVVRVEVKAF